MSRFNFYALAVFSPGWTSQRVRLPVSCTVFVVEDSMEGPNGIEASWKFVLLTLSAMELDVAIHLSVDLRPKGSRTMAKDSLASGPV